LAEEIFHKGTFLTDVPSGRGELLITNGDTIVANLSSLRIHHKPRNRNVVYLDTNLLENCRILELRNDRFLLRSYICFPLPDLARDKSGRACLPLGRREAAPAAGTRVPIIAVRSADGPLPSACAFGQEDRGRATGTSQLRSSAHRDERHLGTSSTGREKNRGARTDRGWRVETRLMPQTDLCPFGIMGSPLMQTPRPVMQVLAVRPVEPVRAEEIALPLDHVRRRPCRAHHVEPGEARRERGQRQAVARAG
jgi:hypothetical protein